MEDSSFVAAPSYSPFVTVFYDVDYDEPTADGTDGHERNVLHTEQFGSIQPYLCDFVETQHWRLYIADAVHDLVGQKGLNVAISRNTEYISELKVFGKDNLEEEFYVVAYDTEGNRYIMTDEFDADNLRQFVQVLTAS
jgi:hypothetical protein